MNHKYFVVFEAKKGYWPFESDVRSAYEINSAKAITCGDDLQSIVKHLESIGYKNVLILNWKRFEEAQ